MTTTKIAIALAGVAALAAMPLHAQGLTRPGARPPVPPMLIKNATIMTVTKGTLEKADLIVQNGKISSIGKGLSAPAGAQVIDATGKFVMPGIVDCHSHTMIDATNEGTLSVTSMVRIQDVLNPTNINIYRELAGGVTTINALHGSANTIGGQNAIVKLKWGRTADEMLFPGAPPGIKFALGENVTQKNEQVSEQASGRDLRYPSTRMGQEEIIRDAFTRAQDYKATWDDYKAALAKGDNNAIPPRKDLELDPLVEVLEGTRLVHAHSYSADEMLMLLGVAKEFGFRVATLQHGLEAYKIASEVAAAGTGVSTFAESWSYKIEAYDAIPYNVAILMRHGVVATVNSDDDGRARRLNIEAAKMMRYGGLTEDEALKTITLNAAIQLGIDKKVGSLEVGKDADITIWNGDPLSVYSSVETTIIDGEVFFDKKLDMAARNSLDADKAALQKQINDLNARARGAAPSGGGHN